MMAYIGIIMLGGIAVSNAIILIDRINQLRQSGLNKKDSIITAGSQRIRPILMTSLTTIFALLPLTIGIGGKCVTQISDGARSYWWVGYINNPNPDSDPLRLLGF